MQTIIIKCSKLTMDLRSLSSSQSDLILLISTESVDLPCPPPSSPEANKINAQSDRCEPNGATVFGSEIVLKHMEARKRSKKLLAEIATTDRGQMSQRSGSQGEDGSIRLHKLSNNTSTEDSSCQNKTLSSKPTFETMRTEKTGRTSIGSWIKKKMLRFKGPLKKSDLTDKSTEETKKEIPGHVVIDQSESIGTSDRDEISTFFSPMSVSDAQKGFGSQDNSIEVIDRACRTIIADDFSAATFSELLDEPKPLQFDFRDKLELYKGHAVLEKSGDLQDRVKLLKQEASFMLLSFSVAPSDSISDEDTTDDNLAEAIAKEMNLRRLIMGEPEPPRINIKEVTIPARKPKAGAVLSPRVNALHQNQAYKSQLDKPTTPLEKIAGFFFGDNENMDSPRMRCGIAQGDFGGDSTISP